MSNRILLLIIGLSASLQTLAQTADFTITKRQGCAPLDAVNFTDVSTGGAVAGRTWDLGKGAIGNNSITVGNNYENAGTYIIILTVTFSNGETRTKKDSITVHPNPVAAFTTNDTAGCAPHTVRLTDLSTTATGTIMDWSWDIGPVNSNQAGPSFQFAANGDYDVRLLVSNSWGCKSGLATKDKYIHVYDRVKAAFSIPVGYSCDTPFTAGFLNSSTGGGAITYKWFFGDGDSAAGANPVHRYDHPGVYPVRVTAKNGSACTDTYTITNGVYAGNPRTSISAADSVCSRSSVLFSGTVLPASFTNAVSWKWIFPGGNVLYGRNVYQAFNSSGTFDVLLVTYYNASCQDTAHHTITVKDGPVARFSPDKSTGCSTPLAIHFFNMSEPPDGITYEWNFGDGSTGSTVQNPSHTYTTAGSFTVTLKVNDTVAGGCSTFIQKANAVNIIRPQIDFTCLPPEGCTPLPVTAAARLTNMADPIVSYTWNFGEGTAVSTAAGSATHTYTKAGTYFTKLTIVTAQGCADSTPVKTIKVTDLCSDDGSGGGGGGSGGAGSFVISKTCADKYTVTFIDTVSNSSVVSWNFGDGTLYTSLPSNTVTHRFPDTAKNYLVIDTRKDNISGETYTVQKRVVIVDERATFYPDVTNTCKDKKVSFTAPGIDSSFIDRYTWDYGDGTPNITINNSSYFRSQGIYLNGNTSHTYTIAGNYTVRLMISDKLGCPDTFAYAIPVVVKGPSAAFTASRKTSCGNSFAVDLTDSSTRNGAIPIQEWAWDFGNGTRQIVHAADSAVHQVFSNSYYYQEYNISLRVTDSLGCQNTSSQVIKSFNPKANFTSTDTLQCGRLQVALFNNSSAYLPAYTWYYGDGSSSSAANGSHAYIKNGVYDITLVVVDNNGCRDSLTKPAFIKLVKTEADFRVGDTSKCGPTSVSFYDSSHYAFTYRWDFGDNGTGSTDKTPSHLYNPGTYQVKLYARGVSGCTDSVTRTVRVKGPVGSLHSGPGAACAPYDYNMEVSGTNITAYAWDYGDGTPVNRTQDSLARHTYNSPGRVQPNVVLTSAEGCAFLLKAAPVTIDAAKAGFAADKSQLCDSGYVLFTDRSSAPAFSSIANYVWDFGDGSQDNSYAPVPHLYARAGAYRVSLAVESMSGCRDTFVLQQPVSVYRHPSVGISGDLEKCAASSVRYDAAVVSEDSISAYAWQLNGVAISTHAGLDHFFANAGTYDLSVGVKTRYGCGATATKSIVIHPLPVPYVSPDTAVCAGRSIQLHAGGGATYSWWPPDGLQDIHSPDPIVTPQKSTVYSVTVTSSFGCTRKDSVRVVADKKVDLQHSRDALICTGGTITLSASGYTQRFLWNPPAGLSNAAVANPVASPQQTTLYQVVGYSANTCPNDTGFVKITVGSLPTVNLGPDLTVDAGTPLLLDPAVSNDVVKYTWEPAAGLGCVSCRSPAVTADKDVAYRLTVTTKYGCEASDDIKITVLCGKGAVRIPDAFTPNGDGNNDVFYVMGFGIQRIKRFSIYSRWGQLVFTRENIAANDRKSGWNGLVNNQQVAVTTTFVYVADIVCNEGKTMQVKGSVLLIR